MNAHVDQAATGGGQSNRWEMPRWWLPFMVGILAIMLVLGSLASVSIIEDEGWVGAAFMTAWFAALAWNLYWWLFRVAYRLELRGDALFWRAPLRRGRLSVNSITGVEPFMGANQIATIRAVGHRSVPVFAYGDLSSFLARLNVINTAVPDRVRGLAGVYDRVTGSIATLGRGRGSSD